MSLLTGLVQENFGPDPIPTALVAHERGRFLGTVSIIECDEDTCPHYTPWVAALWVEPEHRCQRIGAALVGRAVECAFGTGARRVYLLAGSHRQSYYQGLGWSVIEQTEDGMFILARDNDG